MVQRFVFVKLRDELVEGRAAIADQVRALIGGVVDAVEVGVPADDSAKRWDLSIVIQAEDAEAWAAIAGRLTGLFDEWLPARAAVVKAWTFQLRPPR